MIEIVNEKDRLERRRRLAKYESDFEILADDIGSPASLIRVFLSRKSRGEMIATTFLALMGPGISSVIEAENHSVDELRLARTAAALAVWRLEQGNYPNELEQLVPDLLPKLPMDASWNKPFHYEQRGEGYLLYAVGIDGDDNGGNNRAGTIIDGEWVLDKENDVVTDGKDLVIRLPIPALRLPAPPTQR